MELLLVFGRTLKRILGFSLIVLAFYIAFWLFKGLSLKPFLFILAILLWLMWKAYDRLIGNACGDLAVIVRLVMKNSRGIMFNLGKLIDILNKQRRPSVVHLFSPEIIQWKDVESNNTVRRSLSKGRLSYLLGQYDGKPIYGDLAEMGQIFISAPPRSGKTNLIVQVISSILIGHPMARQNIDFVFIDITRDLSLLKPLGKYTNDMETARRFLMDIGKEVDRRNTLREKHNLGGGYWYDIPAPERPKMIVLVIDEAIQVIDEGGKQLKSAWSRLINIGHKNGVLMITTTLYNRGDLIPTEFFSLMYAKIAGYMGTDQALINVIGSDFYQEHKEKINSYVNQKYRFLLCIRGKKPELFQPIYVPTERLTQLIESAVITPDDWQVAALTIWHSEKGDISWEELARKTRQFAEEHPSKVNPATIHKGTIGELMKHLLVSGIACRNGRREHYLPSSEITSYGVLLEKFDDYRNKGGFEKKAPTVQELEKLAA